MPSIFRSRLSMAILAVLGAGAVAGASAQPPDFARSEQQRKAFVRADAASKAPRVVLPATEDAALQQKRVLPGGIIEIPLPADRLLHLDRKVDADGKARIGHFGPGLTGHEHVHPTPATPKPEVAHE